MADEPVKPSVPKPAAAAKPAALKVVPLPTSKTPAPKVTSAAKRVTLQFMGIIWALLLICFGAVIGGGAVYKIVGPGPLNAPANVIVPKGASVRDAAYILQQEGVVKHWLALWVLARIAAEPGQIKAGEYAFPARASLWAVMDVLRSGQVVVHKITVAEGRTSYEIVRALMAEPLLTGDISPLPPEGSLLPETYHFQRGDRRADVIARMQAGMEQTLAELWPQRAPDLPVKTPQEAVILASIIEKETGLDGERSMVAGVFVNRLKQGMKLQSDPTTIYALTNGKGSMQEVLGRQIVRSDWKLANPYNTYHITGLPPGPIANPGRASIIAALKPAATDALFFMADGKGGHNFSRTYEGHNDNIAEYIKRREAATPPAPVETKKPVEKPAPEAIKQKPKAQPIRAR